MSSCTRVISAILAATVMAILSGASSAAYPEKQIWWIVPYAPGGSADVTSRILVTRLSQRLNQTILVDNKSGATGSIGATFVARAAPDGYTIGYGTFDLAINPLVRDLPYDPLKDLTPVTQLSNLWEILVAPAEAPYNTFAEFVEYAKKNPDKINFGTTGAASAGHLSGELLKKATKLEMTHIPFKGGGPGVAAAIGGQVSVYWATGGSAMPSIKAGRLKALAVSAPTRMPSLPNVPTFNELGYPTLNTNEWTASSFQRELRPISCDSSTGKFARRSHSLRLRSNWQTGALRSLQARLNSSIGSSRVKHNDGAPWLKT